MTLLTFESVILNLDDAALTFEGARRALENAGRSRTTIEAHPLVQDDRSKATSKHF